MPRKPHPNKEIEAAVKHAESKGWSVKKGKGHAWGIMYCPNNDQKCRCGTFCLSSIWSTPKSPSNHAKKIRKVVDNCTSPKASDSDAE